MNSFVQLLAAVFEEQGQDPHSARRAAAAAVGVFELVGGRPHIDQFDQDAKIWDLRGKVPVEALTERMGMPRSTVYLAIRRHHALRVRLKKSNSG